MADTTYKTLEEFDTLAATLPKLLRYKATEDDAARQALLDLATLDVETARRYQGRKFDATQQFEFPRVARGPVGEFSDQLTRSTPIWDWDIATNQAVVPRDVLIAILYQAESIAADDRSEMLQKIHDGLASQSTGGMSESYRELRGNAAPVLCRQADVLMQKYRFRSGDML